MFLLSEKVSRYRYFTQWTQR